MEEGEQLLKVEKQDHDIQIDKAEIEIKQAEAMAQ